MFAYFINTTQNNPTNTKKITLIKNLIKSHKISGELYEYSTKEELMQFVAKNTSLGTQTFVTIGNDIDFTLLFNVSPKEKAAFGYIPLDFHSPIATLLGLSTIKEAVTAVSQRKITDYPCLKVNNHDILVQADLDLASAQTSSLEIVVDTNMRGHTIANHVVIKNNLLVPNESKPIELAIYRPTVSANTQTPHEDRLELPASKKLFAKLGTTKEELVIHMKAVRLELGTSEELSSDLIENPSKTLKVRQSEHVAHIITKKQSPRLH